LGWAATLCLFVLAVVSACVWASAPCSFSRLSSSLVLGGRPAFEVPTGVTRVPPPGTWIPRGESRRVSPLEPPPPCCCSLSCGYSPPCGERPFPRVCILCSTYSGKTGISRTPKNKWHYSQSGTSRRLTMNTHFACAERTPVYELTFAVRCFRGNSRMVSRTALRRRILKELTLTHKASSLRRSGRERSQRNESLRCSTAGDGSLPRNTRQTKGPGLFGFSVRLDRSPLTSDLKRTI
jgi:hypothetical protein